MHTDRRTAIQMLVGAGLGATLPAGAEPDAAHLLPGRCGPAEVPGFTRYCFTDSTGKGHAVYVTGDEGPPVVLLHELPGLVRHDLNAARRIAALRYRVLAPLFFGTPNRDSSFLRNLQYTLRYCRDDEFACGEGEKTSPHVVWLRQLCRAAADRWPDGTGVGVIGMCLTGALPVALLQERIVRAAVVCQPTVPFNLFTPIGWFTDFEALGLAPADLARARDERDAPILGLRYTRDSLSRAPRFRRLAQEFGPRFYRLDLEGEGHSTLGLDACDGAFAEVESLLNHHLRATPDPAIAPFPVASRPDVLDPVPLGGCPAAHAAHA